MKINLLGTGGVFPIPRPCCPCALCEKARADAEDTWQTGPSMYIYGESVLFDTPEEIRFQLLRGKIDSVRHIILTHWHPDHTHGLRVIEQITKRRPETMPIHVYIAQEQFELLCTYGSGNMLRFYEKQGMIRIHWFDGSAPICLGSLCISPIYIEKTQGYYFFIQEAEKGKMVYAPCEYHGLEVAKTVTDVDVFIAHCLWFEDNRIGHGVSFADSEDSFETMLSHAKQMDAKRIVITHIEESFASTIEELNQAAKVCYPEYDILFARDGTIIDM